MAPLSSALFPNGVNGATGDYLERDLTAATIVPRITPPADMERATGLAQRAKGTLGLPFGVNPLDPGTSGWGVVAHESEAAAIGDALAPLIAHRQGKVLSWRTGEGRAQWLARHKVAAGTIKPERVPFYLLLAGSSTLLPFSFAHELAVEYCVGRLELDSADDYRNYALRVVSYETNGSPQTARRAAFFGTRHSFDRATQLSADHLLGPLVDPASDEYAVGGTGFTCSSDIGEPATKSRLVEILSESDGTRPSLLFTASHGVGYPAGDPRQSARQGALVCQDWSEPGSLSDEETFAAGDVPDRDLGGLMAFLFACYGAGTPSHDRFPRNGAPPDRIAPEPFVAALPRRLLRQGALAVVGHVDRAWGYSIAPPDAGAQAQPFRNFIANVLTGVPIACAMKDFRERYAALTVSLANLLEKQPYDPVPPEELVPLWIERNDAEGYLVVGDPAARLRSDSIGGAA